LLDHVTYGAAMCGIMWLAGCCIKRFVLQCWGGRETFQEGRASGGYAVLQ